jgi:hypothetical protein
MKKQTKFLLNLALILPIFFIGCQKSELTDDLKTSNPESDGSGSLKSSVIYCGTPTVASLVEWNATTISFGNLTIGNDATNLYVSFDATNGVIMSTDLYVGPESLIPGVNIGGGTGHFNLGLFPYHSVHPYPFVTTYMYTIPLQGLPDCFAVVGNAKMISTDGVVRNCYGILNTLSWGYYFSYCKQICPPPPSTCETAYAYGEQYANCFLNIPGVTSNNWGWSNGPIGPGTYAWPIYAGAGQCNINKGTLVGTLVVNYTPPTAIVTYSMGIGFVLNGTHLYVGSQILPLKNGKFTTAPGQFPYKHDNLNGVISDTFTINGLSGNIYVAAHSEACGNYQQ